MENIKSYRELSLEEKIKTYENYQNLCLEYSECIPYENFNEYDEEQNFLDMDFNENTLECLG